MATRPRTYVVSAVTRTRSRAILVLEGAPAMPRAELVALLEAELPRRSALLIGERLTLHALRGRARGPRSAPRMTFAELTRPRRVTIELPAATHALLVRAAHARGIALESWARDALAAAAREELGARTVSGPRDPAPRAFPTLGARSSDRARLIPPVQAKAPRA